MLTPYQCMSFMRNGYLVLRNVMGEAAREYAVDKIWSCMPSHFRRGDPSSWTGRIEDCRTTSTLFHRRGHVKFQKGCKAGKIGLDPALLSLVSQNDSVTDVVRQLLGCEIGRPYLRGLYSIWPMPRTVSISEVFGANIRSSFERYAGHIKLPYLFGLPTEPHLEGHPMHIVAVGYLTNARKHGGALLVWPGSHHDVYPQFESTMEHIARPGYDTQNTSASDIIY